MIEAYYKGLLLGLVFIMSFGPIFFSLIETSISRGFIHAAAIAVGTSLSDAAFIAVSYFGLSQFFSEDKMVQHWLGIAGGVVLIFFSGLYFFKKPIVFEFAGEEDVPIATDVQDIRVVKSPVHFSKMTLLAYAAKGFAINTLNPFLLVFWLSAVGIVAADTDYTRYDELIFFCGSISCIFFSDLLKAFIASRIQRLLTYKRMLWMNRIAGAVMLYFGIHMLLKTYGVAIP